MRRENFQQGRVQGPSVNDHRGGDAAFGRLNAGFHLRDHTAGQGTVGHAVMRIAGGHFLDQLTVLVEDAFDIGQ